MRRFIATCACALTLGFAAGASATPIRVYAASGTTTSVYANIALYPYAGTRCKVNVFTAVYTNTSPPRKIASLGRNSLDGCLDQTWDVRYPARLARGVTYVIGFAAINLDNYGNPIRHYAFRRFRVR